MIHTRRYLMHLLLGLGIGFASSLGLVASADVKEKPKQPPQEQAEAKQDAGLPLQELRTFAEIFGRIKSDYVEQVNDRELLESAVRGMLAGLDPHSTYLNEEAYTELQVGTRGEFGGLGIEVGMEDGFVKVIAPIDDTPAQRAGIQSGDLIIRLDDKPVKGMSLNDAVKMMRGKPGTEIRLTIVREQEDKPLVVTVVRDVIRVASVKGRMLDKDVGYLRITHFQTRTIDDMLKRLAKLEKQNKAPLAGLVLDLRNNPGGILNAAVSVSDAFLEDGIIVYTKGRVSNAELEFRAAPDDVLEGAPIVVLVNEGSASASEIVAGALQDHKRAVIMGQPTFGKGSVQTIIPINNKSAVKLTTALYFTPSGRSIQAEGIEPDIELADLKVEAVSGKGFKGLKEADLSGHLEKNGKKKDEKSEQDKDLLSIELEKIKNGDKDKQSDVPVADDEDDEPLATKDYALYQALNMLKGMLLLRPAG